VVHKFHDSAAAAPVAGYLPFSTPGDVITFYRGPMGLRVEDDTAAELPGVIALVLRSGSHLQWGVDMGGASLDLRRQWRHREGHPRVTLTAPFHGATVELDVHLSGDGQGFFGGLCTSGDGDAPLREVIAHWVNLPDLPHGAYLCHEDPDGSWTEWGGRWALALGDWEIVIDARPDLRETLAEAKRERLYAVTHTMRARRNDGATFTGREAQDLRVGLQIAFSFALGRWTAPVLAVGRDATGSITWSEWSPLHLDSPAKAHGRWWVEHRPVDLQQYLALFIARWGKADQRDSLRFLATSAIAAGESGFLEQQVMTAIAALEHLAWRTFRRDDGSAAERLGRLLKAMSVPPEVSSEHQPALATFCQSINGNALDALVRIRNSITHPKQTPAIYRQRGLLSEASLLASRYLDLAVLHSLGYAGRTADRTITTGWAGDGAPVPWVDA